MGGKRLDYHGQEEGQVAPNATVSAGESYPDTKKKILVISVHLHIDCHLNTWSLFSSQQVLAEVVYLP